MRVLQVKQYHTEVASKKYAMSNGGVQTMFYFFREDNHGYPTTVRQNGWIAFNNTKSVWGRNKEEAIRKFQE